MRRIEPRRPTPHTRHVQPLAHRQDAVGAAVRWAMRQGLVSLGLHVVGLASFVVAAFILATALGFVVLGAACIVMETLTNEGSP